jgi:hypothetical protein
LPCGARRWADQEPGTTRARIIARDAARLRTDEDPDDDRREHPDARYRVDEEQVDEHWVDKHGADRHRVDRHRVDEHADHRHDRHRHPTAAPRHPFEVGARAPPLHPQ